MSDSKSEEVIYEVNLSLDSTIAEAYQTWLFGHIDQLLKFDGFLSAETFLVEKEPNSTEKNVLISVRYRLKSRAALQNYITNHSAGMRKETIEKFGDKFSATRRVLLRNWKS